MANCYFAKPHGMQHCYIPFFMLLISPQFARSASMAFRITRRIVATAEDAEDAVQDSLQQAFTHFKSSKGDSRISTWLSRIVTNAALMRPRKNKVRRELSFDEPSISHWTSRRLMSKAKA
jgi:DNA-directed RNA polymerase specialized sigma24 family protein